MTSCNNELVTSYHIRRLQTATCDVPAYISVIVNEPKTKTYFWRCLRITISPILWSPSAGYTLQIVLCSICRTVLMQRITLGDIAFCQIVCGELWLNHPVSACSQLPHADQLKSGKLRSLAGWDVCRTTLLNDIRSTYATSHSSLPIVLPWLFAWICWFYSISP